MPTKKKNKSLSGEDKKLIEEIIRVDHAGEHGATQIYRGQLAIFKENTEFGKEIKEMADQEEIHKSTFDKSKVETRRLELNRNRLEFEKSQIILFL